MTNVQGRALAKFCVATSGPHKVYTVLAHPTVPWHEVENDPHCAWTFALERACVWADGTTTTNAMLAAITSNLFYNCGFRYDTIEGAARYFTGTKFKLDDYLKVSTNVVCCYDQAHGVVSLGNLLGASARPVYTELFGYINTTNLIGVGACNNPFFEGRTNDVRICVLSNGIVHMLSVDVPRNLVCSHDDYRRSLFGNHMYAMEAGLIFDACAGPFLGTVTHANYLNNAIDHSTDIESDNGYYSRVIRGVIRMLNSGFRVQ